MRGVVVCEDIILFVNYADPFLVNLYRFLTLQPLLQFGEEKCNFPHSILFIRLCPVTMMSWCHVFLLLFNVNLVYIMKSSHEMFLCDSVTKWQNQWLFCTVLIKGSGKIQTHFYTQLDGLLAELSWAYRQIASKVSSKDPSWMSS